MRGEEDVLGLQVPVQDPTLMDVMQGEGELGKPRENLVLRERPGGI